MERLPTPLLEVRNLKTHFFLRRGVIKAVDGVSFSLEKGGSIGLVGESGCGKTITAMSVMRLEPRPAGRIVEGEILLEGEDLVPKSEAEMTAIRGCKISLIMQDPMTSLNPAYTIGNQLAEAIKLHGSSKDKEAVRSRVIEVLRQVEIPAGETRMREYPHQMSGGMRQRVVGAMAIVCFPLLLIADEPTTALDVTTQRQYLRLLKKLQAETGMAMMFITHDLGIVARMCDYVCVMYLGKVVERAPVRELWDHPRHPYTIALMEAVPDIKTKVQRLRTIEGMVPSHLDLPCGCNFHPRCARAIERCREAPPPEECLGDAHYVSCWRASE